MWLLVTAYVLDRIVGDPVHWPHPVRLIGKSIVFLEKMLYRDGLSPPQLLFRGGVMMVLVLGFTAAATVGFLSLLMTFHPIAGQLGSIYLAFTTLSSKSLADAAKNVAEPLKHKNVASARKELGKIVGRDTQELDESAIVRGAVESVSENFSDGVVAPLFYLALGGVPMALMYKAVNTLDSMVGFKNRRYQYFGRPSARIDDAMNWIPARISAWLLLVASVAGGEEIKQAYSILRRDARSHSSPNSGYPEAAMAGILGIQLGGPSYYLGELVEKPFIGDHKITPDPDHIDRATQLMLSSSILGLFMAVMVWLIKKGVVGCMAATFI